MNEYEATHIFAHLKKWYRFMYSYVFYFEIIEENNRFFGQILKHIRIIRKITYDLQIKFL